MSARHGTTPIPLPSVVDDPRWIGRFSREVRKSIAALRDRKIVNSTGIRRAPPSNPWKVYPNGDGTVSVSDGVVMGFVKGVTGDATFLGEIAEWTKADKTVTGSGYIYALLTYDYLTGLGTITVEFSTTAPDSLDPDDDKFHIAIAEVSLSSGVAVVDKQLLNHNPILQLITPTTHPFKVTNGGSGNAQVNAGFILGYYLVYTDANPGAAPTAAGTYTPSTIVLGPSSKYAGGTVAVTGTQYIYAETAINYSEGASDEYTETYIIQTEVATSTHNNGLEFLELYDMIEPQAWTGSPLEMVDSVTLVASSNTPDVYTPTAGKAAVCLAKVTNASGTITVDKQYVTHNPTLFLPIGQLSWSYD